MSLNTDTSKSPSPQANPAFAAGRRVAFASNHSRRLRGEVVDGDVGIDSGSFLDVGHVEPFGSVVVRG